MNGFSTWTVGCICCLLFNGFGAGLQVELSGNYEWKCTYKAYGDDVTLLYLDTWHSRCTGHCFYVFHKFRLYFLPDSSFFTEPFNSNPFQRFHLFYSVLVISLSFSLLIFSLKLFPLVILYVYPMCTYYGNGTQSVSLVNFIIHYKN